MNHSIVVTKTCLDMKFRIYWHYGYWVTWVQQKTKKNNYVDKNLMGNVNVIIVSKIGILTKYLVYGLVSTCFLLQNCKNNLKLKVRTDFPNIAIPIYIQGTTVPCNIMLIYSPLLGSCYVYQYPVLRDCYGICIPTYIWKFSSYFQFQVILAFNDFTVQHMSKLSCEANIFFIYHFYPKL